MYINYFTPLPLKGWLFMKRQSTVRKSWTQRYFVLESKELRCYKNELDTTPILTFNLRHYKLEIPSASSISSPSSPSSTKQNIFKLIGQTSDLMELILQADNEKHFTQWVDTLEQHLGEQDEVLNEDPLYVYSTQSSTDVLDRWLEKYDLLVPSTDRHTPSLISLAPSSTYDNDADSDYSDDEFPNMLSPMTPTTMTHYPPPSHQALNHNMDGSKSSPTSTSTSSSSSKFFGFLLSISGSKKKHNNNKSSQLDSRIH
ncbi:hypothetical protein BJ944DRAFT_244096 [Cunninghamella echinulata]|nr:hypothetical protein BJ944DRAFT_244096 [Cunninghamella echinulata]